MAIAKKGSDLIYGFNLDIDPDVWKFDLYKTKKYFTVGITVGSTTYFTHGVNNKGHFSNVPYMNGEAFMAPHGTLKARIDLLADRYIRGKYSFDDIVGIAETRAVTNIPAATMHSLIGDEQGRFLILEPGYGYEKVSENYAILTNFPVLANLTDYSNPFYGKARYDKALDVLKSSTDCFSAEDALSLLSECKQEGKWGTRVSFVYSKNDNAVYYFLNGDSSKVEIHRF